MIQSIREAIKSLMSKSVISGLMDQLTILQAIDSNDEQIQDIIAKQPLYVYKAIINQSGTNAPEARVLTNTFPSATFVYIAVGDYQLELGASAIDLNVTTIQQTCYNGVTAFNISGFNSDSVSVIYQINTYDSSRVAADDLLVDYTLIIEAYPAE